MAHPDGAPAPSRSAGLGGLPVIIGALVMMLAVAVIAALLVANSDSSTESAGSAQEALGYLPIDASSVEIRDQRLAEQRLGIDSVETGADDAQIEHYLTQARDNPSTYSSLTPYLSTMNDAGAAFTALDVDWSASVVAGSLASSSHLELYGMDAGLDLNGVADNMVDAGWRASDVAGGQHLEVDVSDLDPQTGLAGGYPGRMAQLVLLPDEHLMVTGDYEGVLAVIAGDSEPLRAADEVSRLLAADESPEYLHLTRGGAACVGAAVQTLGERISPELLAQLRQSTSLATPTATASLAFVDGAEVTTTSRLLFGNESQAADDKDARATYLREGTSVITRQPIADLLTVESVTVDGSIETITYTFERGLAGMVSAIYQRDFPPTLCVV